MAAQLPLRDVHLPSAPGWWPLAPGWWAVVALLVIVVVLLGGWAWHRRRRRQRWLALFDEAIADASGPAQQLAAASEMLRRAAPPVARRLSGEAWLEFLDGTGEAVFSQGAGRMTLVGGFQREVDPEAAADACRLARRRFIELMAQKR